MKSLRNASVAVAVVLGVLALWLALDNPDLGPWSRGESYQCLAPWDTVVNGASNFPGGELESDSEDIAARCREAGRQRFVLASGSAIGCVAIGLLAVIRRRAPIPR